MKAFNKKQQKTLHLKRLFLFEKLHFFFRKKERGGNGEKKKKRHFLRIVCKGNVLPKHVYFMSHY